MTRRARQIVGVTAWCVAVMALAGCRNHMPHAWTWPYGGDLQRSYAAPPGEQANQWDPYAASIEITPVEDTNPVRTQHILIATVRDKDGRGLPNRRVEWILSDGSVGDIVEVDTAGWRHSRGIKVTNDFAVTHTSDGDKRNFFKKRPDRIAMGTGNPADDIILEEGQTWIAITSPIEGETHIVAYAPGIYDWSKHKAFAVKRWMDVVWEFPPAATNPTGTAHEFVTKVSKASDGSPLAGYKVTYRILDGPAGSFSGGGDSITVMTDAQGMARTTLNQARPAEGTNNVEITIVRGGNDQCCQPEMTVAVGRTSKTWIGPKIAIQKDCVAQAMLGEQFTYNIVVTNPSQVPTNGVVVTDPLPDGIDFVSSNPPATPQGRTLTWSGGTLPGGGTWRAEVVVRGTRKGSFQNTASVRTDEGLTAQDGCETRISEAALQLQKTCTPEVTVCDEIVHTVTVTNPGDAAARNVRVVDRLPDGLTTLDGRNELVFDGGTIEPGQSKQATFKVKASRTGRFTNTAMATADGGLSAQDSCEVVVRKPELRVTKTAPGERYIGRNAEYTVTVTNTGDAPARDTVVTDMLPPGVEFVSADSNGSLSGRTITWSAGTLDPGASRTFKLVVRATDAMDVKNVVTARAFCAEAQAEADMTVRGIPAILLEVVDVEDPIEVGENVTYIITVTNQGSAVGTNIRITCTVQPEGSPVSAEGPSRASVSGQTVTFDPIPTLAPKQRATFKVVVKANSPKDTRFAVSMVTDQQTTPVTETESTYFYE